MSEDEPNQDFAKLLAENQSRLYGYIYALVQDWGHADDIFQQTVLAMWRKHDQLEKVTNFSAWALKFAHWEILNFRRRESRSRLMFSDVLLEQLLVSEQERLSEVLQNERFVALENCVGKLKASDRELIQQNYANGQKIQSIAKSQGRSPQSICNSLKRIRSALLRCVDAALASE